MNDQNQTPQRRVNAAWIILGAAAAAGLTVLAVRAARKHANAIAPTLDDLIGKCENAVSDLERRFNQPLAS